MRIASQSFIFSLCFTLLLAGCSTTSTSDRYQIKEDRAPDSSPTLDHIEDAQPRYEAKSLAGNVNYNLNGQHYTILPSDQPFTQEGLASWYGKKFHGHQTSNGEIYDMYSMTAAHKTLPLPSYVRVTNRNNGKTAIVRVNDRGPFHEGRIIDLSMAAATKLDVIGHGTAPVSIELIQMPKPDKAEWQSANPRWFFVQLAAFSDLSKAQAAAQKLKTEFNTQVELKKAKSAAVYRLRLGPYLDSQEAEHLRDQARASQFPEAFVVSELRELN
ncbi:septal ring lytic transglycosylase RlpA family protein [Photobacterium sp. CCB-ST2H9]|uniref:septal ring lytic transglycosylase RlpA family protein n=1 Tax=unclassified Photobacterium TaxID=2628852 RepID=UPI0020059734|nr:septal ring lytic transglycosylase RlpA family protein [Photobacterium sp. CCB-ST2H9]UTM57956.1 septal ring lytic transglycosylase RlpA family protein [Photobacterium sp. CCB-ST2H9]